MESEFSHLVGQVLVAVEASEVALSVPQQHVPPMTFPVEESLAAAGVNDLRVFFVNRLGVFP